MSRNISILAVTISLFCNTNVFAWGWKDAVNQAISQNPSLNGKRANSEEFRLRYQNAKTYRYPTLDLVGQYLEYEDQTRTFRNRAYIGPELQYLLFQGGKVGYGIDQAEAQNNQADINVRVQSVTTQSKLREAFAGALYAKNYLKLAHEIEKRRDENMKLTKVRYQSGLEFRWVYLSYDAKLNQAHLDVQEAEMNKKTALADLEVLLDKLPIESVEEIQDADFFNNEAAYNLEQMISTIDQNPNYLYKVARIEEAKARVDYNVADYYPQIGIQADAWGLSVNSSKMVPAWYVGGQLRMPLFRAGRVRKSVNLAKAQLSESVYDLAQTKLDLKTTLQKTFKTYQIAKQQVEIGKQKVEAAETRAKVVARQYRSGLATFLDWDASQDGWVNAEIDLLNNIRNYQVARGKLDEAMGLELGL